MRYDLRPTHPGRVTLFRHSGEAIVFWLALIGLVVVSLLSVFRYRVLRTVLEEYRNLPPAASSTVVQLAGAQARMDSLEAVQVQMRTTITRLESDLAQLADQAAEPAPTNSTVPATPTDPLPTARKEPEPEIIALPPPR